MNEIAKGSPEAWATRRVLEAWVAKDSERFDRELVAAGADLPGVVRTLIIITGGQVQSVANLANLSFDEVLANLWMQLAADERDDDAAQLMRSAVTAWANGDNAAAALIESGAFQNVSSDDLVMHLAGVSEMLGRRLTESLNAPFSDAMTGWWIALGVVGADPDRAS
jgi:hypothetical protein